MSPVADPMRERRRAPEILAERPVSAEVVVAPATLTVTFALPTLARADAEILLTRHALRIRHRTEPARLNLLVPLPVAVEPERYVLRHRNGVYDVVAERASR